LASRCRGAAWQALEPGPGPVTGLAGGTVTVTPAVMIIGGPPGRDSVGDSLSLAHCGTVTVSHRVTSADVL
jgi:hypothetical protein